MKSRGIRKPNKNGIEQIKIAKNLLTPINLFSD
jgi:hypothetical protein